MEEDLAAREYEAAAEHLRDMEVMVMAAQADLDRKVLAYLRAMERRTMAAKTLSNAKAPASLA